MKKKIYELVKDYVVVASGTIEEIAMQRGCKPKSIDFYRYPSYTKKFENLDDAYLLFCMTDFEEETDESDHEPIVGCI